VSVADTGIGIAGNICRRSSTVLHDQAGGKRPRTRDLLRDPQEADGIITVRSKIGAGAVFRVYLPALPGKGTERRPG